MKRVLSVMFLSLSSSLAFSSSIMGITADGDENVFKIEDVRSIKLTPQKANDKGYSTIVFGVNEDVSSSDDKKSVVPIMFYPNPVSEYIIVTGTEETDEVVVTDMQGSVVLRTIGTRIDVSALPQGVYLLSVQGKTVKFMKK